MTQFSGSKADVRNNAYLLCNVLQLKPITTAERDLIPNIVDGMQVYNGTENKFQDRTNGVWVDRS